MNLGKPSWSFMGLLIAAASILFIFFGIRLYSRKSAGSSIADFAEANPEFFGILEIKGLLREPVVQGKDNSYYLSHGFDGSKDRNGCLFADESYREGEKNLVIYGHNSFNKTRFSDLVRYKEPGFASGHREITLTEKDRSCSVFRIAMVLNYSVSDIATCDPFRTSLPDDCLSRYRKYARYYLDEDVQLGDHSRMLTLSTCDESVYGTEGRLIVIAIREDCP